LIRLNFQSCFHVPVIGNIELPAKMRDVGNIFLDESRQLWISSLIPDDYLNASLYQWPDGTW
jgi:hypothetical protein